ncbi:MAG: hypothetical protein K0R24_32 [Gammaproteobacteria bacterium]|jgi:hypothetical protein|nr:hypothetical protein [Gammaproteobacteria bacterium]
MFFDAYKNNPDANVNYANRVINQFCIIIIDEMPVAKQLENVQRILVLLRSFSHHFEKEKENIRKMYDNLSPKVDPAKVDPAKINRVLFEFVAAMSVLISIFSKEENKPKKQAFIDVIEKTIVHLEKKESELQKKIAAQPQTPSKR